MAEDEGEGEGEGESEHENEATPPDEPLEPPPDREEVAASLRTLLQLVCTTRFGAVPAAVAEALAQEVDLGSLARWYIGAGTLSADELSVMVRAPRPS
jgi:hypothetical protein